MDPPPVKIAIILILSTKPGYFADVILKF